ncbi:tape measure protein [Acinetobacter sp. YH12108]|uniref:tape measure protein n=1 Tax=Acinetobacter sp. YH12108 TaxID=2601095 RepID=UPI0015D0DEEE|nr:tape measure protein [Acinetobacter sp. YH12108]
MATKLGTLTLNLAVQIGQYTEGFKKAGDVTERESRRIEKSTNSATAAIKNLGALALAGFSVDAIVGMADSYTQMAARIRNATDSAQEYNLVQDRLLATANGTYRALSEAQEVYLSLSGGMKSLGKSTSDTLDVADSLSYAFVANAARADQAQSAMDALNKSMAKGKIDADAWISIVSAADNIIGDMAKQTGRTEEEVRKLGATGKISLNELLDTLQATTEKNKELADAMENSVADGFQKLSNSVTVYLGKLNESTGATGQIAGALGMLGDNIETVAESAMVLGAYWVGTYIPSVYASTTATIQGTAAKVADTIAARAKALADYDVAKANLASTAAMVRSMGVTNAQTAAMMTNARAAYQQAAASRAAAVAGTSALGLLGGPVGIGVTLAAVAAGYLLMKDSTDESTKSLRENNESVDEAIKKYQELDEVRRRSQMVSEKEKLRDLGQEYDEVNSKLITATYSFSRHNDMTSEQSKQVNALIAEYKQTGDIDKFSQKINSLSFVNQESKDKFNTLAGSVKTAGNEFKNQKSFVDQMAPAVKGVGDQAKQTASEVANLSEEIKKLLNESNRNIKDAAITKALADRGYNDTMIELVKKYMAVEGAITTNAKGQQVLKSELIAQLRIEYQAAMKAKNAVDDRNKSEEKTRKLIEAQGEAMKVNAKVAANAAKYNFAAIEAKNGLPAGLLSAIHMQESRGNPNAYNKSSGAAGGFQFLKGTAEQYGVTDRYNLAQAAEGAGKYLAYLIDLFKGDINKAISAYHAGEGNVQRGTNIGPVNRQYVKNIKGYLGGSSGVAFTEEYSFDDWLKELEQHVVEQEKLEKELADKKQSIQVNYYNEWQKLEFDNQEKIKEINEAFASDPTERDRLLDLQQKAYGEDVANWIKAQDERVKAENEANQQIILARRNAFAMMNEPLGAMNQMGIDAKAQASMSPQQYQKWQLNNDQQSGYSQLADQLYSAQSAIENNEYLETTERYRQLEQAYEAYLQNKAALSEAYNKQEQDLARSQYESQMGIWSNLLGQAQNTWSQMTQAVKDSEGEQSAAFKAMFLMQQMFAVSSALVSTHLAATQVAADATIPFFGAKVAASKLMLAMGYANVGMIAGQTIAGMAHDGIDNIPKEGTWLLDKGERVVDSRTNSDLKDFIANGGNGPQININVPPGYTAEQSRGADGAVTIDIVEKQIKRSWGNLSNPNSYESKQIQRNTTAGVKR